MGHEVAHALARHGNERMSQALITQVGLQAFGEALRDKPEETRALWLGAVGAGAQYAILLPYSRMHETEADRIGLVLTARAGYDPRQAIAFWTRMSQLGGAKPPEFLSTHPADTTRIENLRKYLPEALVHYRP